MTDVYRANRRFERMLPGIAEQERLRTTDPEKYQEHMRRLSTQPFNHNEGILISSIDERWHTGPNGERVCISADLVQYNLDGSENSREVIYNNPQKSP